MIDDEAARTIAYGSRAEESLRFLENVVFPDIKRRLESQMESSKQLLSYEELTAIQIQYKLMKDLKASLNGFIINAQDETRKVRKGGSR